MPADADARVELDRLVGLDEHVVLHVGPHAIRAEFEEGRSTDERISAVQYTRYRLPPEARAALADARDAGGDRRSITRATATACAATDEMRASLAADLG